MDSITELIDPQIVLLVGAIAVLTLLLRLMFQVLRAGFGSLLAIAVVMLILNYGFGVSPKQVWLEISYLPQELARLTQSWT